NMFNSSTGDADFLKEGASLGFYWYGSRKTIYVPELADVEVSKVYLYLGQFKGSNKFINNLSIRQVNLTKNNV
ncbi:phage tail protein, partial [Lactococcus lactis]